MTRKYLAKFRAYERSPQAPAFNHAFFSALGALIAVSVVALLSKKTGVPFMMAPFGATCVLAFGVQDSPLAQPRHVVGGHLLAALSGLLWLWLAGPVWWSAALAVALALALMQLGRAVHPPAGATPLVVLASGANWHFLLTPVLSGALVIVALGWLLHRWRQPGSYPRYWW